MTALSRRREKDLRRLATRQIIADIDIDDDLRAALDRLKGIVFKNIYAPKSEKNKSAFKQTMEDINTGVSATTSNAALATAASGYCALSAVPALSCSY